LDEVPGPSTPPSRVRAEITDRNSSDGDEFTPVTSPDQGILSDEEESSGEAEVPAQTKREQRSGIEEPSQGDIPNGTDAVLEEEEEEMLPAHRPKTGQFGDQFDQELDDFEAVLPPLADKEPAARTDSVANVPLSETHTARSRSDAPKANSLNVGAADSGSDGENEFVPENTDESDSDLSDLLLRDI
jgi:hypothetical protein